MTKPKHAIIIGAGIAGIAAAIRLRNKGYTVEVFEQNDYVGGKLTAFQLEGYRFDAGPSLFTMPQLVEELFEISGKKTSDYFQYSRLDTICHYFYEDGTQIKAFADPKKFAEEVGNKTNDDPQSVLDFLKDSHQKYELTADLFLFNSLHKLSNYWSSKTIKGILGLPKLGVFSTMHNANKKCFEDPRTVQLFDRFATYNGSSPYLTPATLNIIPHLEHNIGAFLPKGGMHSITKSLHQLSLDLGITFHLSTPIDKIILDGDKAIGVKTKEAEHAEHTADIIVSNIDVSNTYHHLLKDIAAPEKILSQPKSSSALIFYWGINEQLPQLATHNIFFSENYKEEFEHIFEKGTLYEDPTIYIHMTSRLCPDDAPVGHDSWFVMINTPNDTGQDWEEHIQVSRQRILSKLSKMLGKDVQKMIQCEEVLDPRTIATKTGSSQGALYGNSSNNRYAAFLRHANFSEKLKNLYFCGGSVHPGGGIPLCLSSAKIVADLI